MSTTSLSGATSGPKQWVSFQRQLIPKLKECGNVKMHQSTYLAALQEEYMNVLDSDLILKSQKITEGPHPPSELHQVERIALRGYHVHGLDDEALLSCLRLRICNLSDCYVHDVRAFYGSINLIKLNLSNNQIAELPPSEFWSSLLSLRVLYLNGNLLSTKESLTGLNGCPRLHILTLSHTPLSLIRNYRHHVVNSVFTLKALDQHVISDQEIIENLQVTETFRALTRHFRLPLHVVIKPGSSAREEVSMVFRLLYAVDRVLAKHSPVVLLQSWIRGWSTRRALIREGSNKIRELVVRNWRKTREAARIHSLPRHLHPLHQPQIIVTPPHDAALFSNIIWRQQESHHLSLHEILKQSQGRYPHLQQGLLQQGLGQHPHPQDKDGVSLPCPPPSTPQPPHHHGGTVKMVDQQPSMLETHILGLDNATKKLKYSMHINLGRLQHNIEQSEVRDSAAGVVTLPSVGVFRKKKTSRSSRERCVQLQVPSKKAKKRLEKTEIQKEEATVTKAPTKAPTKVMATAPTKVMATTPTKAMASKSDGRLEAGGEERKGNTLGETDGEGLSGVALSVLLHEEIPDVSSSKRENVQMMRQAKQEISKHLLRLKQAQGKSPKVLSKPDAMSRDDLVFTRVQGTMQLSVLERMEKVHHTHKLREEHVQKASLVARVRRERVTKREKIEALQRHLKERIQQWKHREEGKLDLKKEALDQQRQAKLMEQYQRQEQEDLNLHKQKQDKELLGYFRQNTTLIGNTLSAEDRHVSADVGSATAKEQVGQIRQDSLEQQEEARKYLELRRERLQQQGRQDKQGLDARLLERACQDQMEVKRKIAKEISRKETARASIAMAKEEMRAHPHGPGEAMTSAAKGKAMHMQGDHSISPGKGFGMGSEFKSPKHITRMSQDSYQSWQRGVKAVEMNKQFPMLELEQAEQSPLMYQMMLPRLPVRYKETTPFTELNSSCASLPQHDILQLS